MKSLGICLGASTLGMVLVEQDGPHGPARVIHQATRAHDGAPRRVLEALLGEAAGLGCDRVAFTGRKLRQHLLLPSIPEPEAVERAYAMLRGAYPGVEAIVSAGGETCMVYRMDPAGRVADVHTGNKCASGTGDFFLQQLRRMDMPLQEALEAGRGQTPYPIASRCSVFAKSDCTHALNKGQGREQVVAGLCHMMSGRILALVRKAGARRVLFTGGTALNGLVRDFLQEEDLDLIVPEQAQVFEALGAAHWGLEHGVPLPRAGEPLFLEGGEPFPTLPALGPETHRVAWKTLERGKARAGDRCLLGLDVGSTTTKAVLLRRTDKAILASVYLRTNGDPVGAARSCYRELARQIPVHLRIQALGVTGSGRQIAGLHGLTGGVVNEIIAHATAAVHFDPEVDTIFEIGGQDAKYTSLCNRVASDYAMNEACSAGTGSFLEEAARESLGVATEAIAEMALAGQRPPDFSDQCAAFISSDVKTAIQEGLSREDICAGLVYSVCRNYLNRVKGGRGVGRKVFMQGGVCYNRAVPVAMAALTGQSIVVPPEPGLMGAFGVALEVEQRLELGLLEEGDFDLRALADRELAQGQPFTCAGGAERCDLKCRISVVEVEGKRYPFGGSCNRYANLRACGRRPAEGLDLVGRREQLVFQGLSRDLRVNGRGARVGINRSMMVHTLFPFYYTFFAALDMEVVLAGAPDPEGCERKGASFCHPLEQAHGSLASLLKEPLDYVFLPQVRGMRVEGGAAESVVCPLAQGEPYVLKAAFPELEGERLLSPVLDFSGGWNQPREELLALGRRLGFRRSQVLEAFEEACRTQRALSAELARLGREALGELEAHPERTGIVLFGRPYNAFSRSGNLGIPAKFASRGHLILPLDALGGLEEEASQPGMYWSMGQLILKAARLVKRHPQLYAAYITNFSCGPDSFLLGYFRDIMGDKPSLTLELDSHTADAGLDTRIEAFLDIVAAHRARKDRGEAKKPLTHVRSRPERLQLRRTLLGQRPVRRRLEQPPADAQVLDPLGQPHGLRDPRVKVIVPCLGETLTRYFAAVLRRGGARAEALPPAGEAQLKLGRCNSSCKECLPFALVTGSCLDYLEHRKDPEEQTVIFLPESSGPCRFGQYSVELARRLRQKGIGRVSLLSLSCEDGYAGLGTAIQLRAWRAIVLSDVMDEIHGALLVLARDKARALATFARVNRLFERALEERGWESLGQVLDRGARMLARIPLKGRLEDVPKVALAGEVFVRRDPLSRQGLVERLAERGILCKVAPIHEWMHYTDYLFRKAVYLRRPTLAQQLGTRTRGFVQHQVERHIKQTLSRSGLYQARLDSMDRMLDSVRHLIPPQMVGGDAAVTVASAMNDIVDDVHGIIALGPFGCLPNRLAEAILTHSLDRAKGDVTRDPRKVRQVQAEHPSLPFLAIESDGGAFPQVVQARLESFCLQVERLHETCARVERGREGEYAVGA